MAKFYIGVDGGATKCAVRLEDGLGELIGHEIGGPANIRLSTKQAWESINSCINKLLLSKNIDLSAIDHQIHVGMGLAGTEVIESINEFISYPNSFATLRITSDAHAACLGAHAGQDGTIIIVGTGSVGLQLEGGQISTVGGYGFPHDDVAGGAWLGLQAVGILCQSLDGRRKPSAFSEAIFNYFQRDKAYLTKWANQATSTQFAELAPLIIDLAKKEDEPAIELLRQAAAEIEKMAEALYYQQKNSQPLPCVLIGSIAPFLEQYLSVSLRARLRPRQLSPEQGAIMLVKNDKQ